MIQSLKRKGFLTARQSGLAIFILLIAVVVNSTGCGGGSGDSGGSGGNSNPPVLALNTQSLVFEANQTVKVVTVSNQGGGTLNWQIGSNYPSWISFSTTNGALGESQTTDVTVSIDRSVLTPGIRSETITIEADGTSLQLTIVVNVPNLPPVVQITAPENNSNFTTNDTINFHGSATDPEEGTLTGSALVWTSNLDGQLGTGTDISATLSPGTHSITLTAKDSGSLPAAVSIAVIVSTPKVRFWEPTNGPYGGIINSFVANSKGDMFASTGTAWANGTGTGRNGVFRSKDNGNSWTQVNNGLFTHVNTLAVDSQDRLFAGTYFGGVFISTDNGDSWLASNKGIKDQSAIVDAFTVNANDDVFIGTRRSGVYRSTDHGENWMLLENGLPADYSATALAIAPNGDIYLTSIESSDSVYRSTDNGDNWTKVYTSPIIYSLAINSVGDIFVTKSGLVIRSINNGATWQTLPLPSDLIYNKIAINSNDDLFVATTSGGSNTYVDLLYRSTDNGSNWTVISDNLGRTDIQALWVNAADELFAGTDGGIYRSGDNGENWQPLNNGLMNSIVYVLAVDSKNRLFAGTSGGMHYSTDKGTTWSKVGAGLPRDLSVTSLATTSNDEILAGIGDFGYKEGGMIFRSMDNGGTWTDISTTLSSSNSVVGIVVNNNGVIFAAMSTTSAEGDGIFRSTDGGSTWGQVNNGLAQTKMSALAINAKGDLFASASGILYRSINSGDTWSPLSSENSAITGVSTIAIATNGDIYTESANGIYRSSNNGDSWESIATGFANSQARRIYVTPNGGVFVGTSGKVYRLNDSGTAWTVLEYDINKPIYKAPMAITSDATGVVYVGLDGGGVYRSISAGN